MDNLRRINSWGLMDLTTQDCATHRADEVGLEGLDLALS